MSVTTIAACARRNRAQIPGSISHWSRHEPGGKQGRRQRPVNGAMRAPDDKPLTSSSGNFNEFAFQHGGVRWGLCGWTIWVYYREFLRVISPDSLTYKILGLLFCLRSDPFRCLAPVRTSVGGVCPLRRSYSWKKANERLVLIRAFQLTYSNTNCFCKRRWVGVQRVGCWVCLFRHVLKRSATC